MPAQTVAVSSPAASAPRCERGRVTIAFHSPMSGQNTNSSSPNASRGTHSGRFVSERNQGGVALGKYSS